jgi:ketosteroid isomerase-like protein
MKRLLTLLLVAIALPAFGQAAAPSDADVTAAITKLREGLVSSFQKGDIEALLTFLDPDVVVTWQNGEVCRGPEAVRAYYNRMMTGESRRVRQITSAPEVVGRQVHGDWAVSWGNLHDHFVLTDGSDLPLNSVFTATIARHGERWLVTAFHASVNAFDNPVLSLAVRKLGLWAGLGGGVAGLFLGWVIARVTARPRRAG